MIEATQDVQQVTIIAEQGGYSVTLQPVLVVNGGGGGALTLQEVTTAGATTTDNITTQGQTSTGTRANGDLIHTIGDYDSIGTETALQVNTQLEEVIIKANSGLSFEAPNGSGFKGVIDIDGSINLTAERRYIFQDKSGTIALTTDVEGKTTANIGTVIPLDSAIGHQANMATANTNTAYTLGTAVTGAVTRVFINTATQPTVTGAVQEGGVAWATGDMYMVIFNKAEAGGSADIVYWFYPKDITGGASTLQEVITAGNTYVDVFNTWTWGDEIITYVNSDENWGFHLSGEELKFTDALGNTSGKSVFAEDSFRLGNGTYVSGVFSQNITADRTLQLPDKDGTLAVTDDLIEVATYSATSTATTTLDCDTFDSRYQILTINTDIQWSNTPSTGVGFVRNLEVIGAFSLGFSTSTKVIGTYVDDGTTINLITVNFANYPTVGLRTTVLISQ